MNREEYINEMLDVIYDKYKYCFLNEGDLPNLVTLNSQMCTTIIDYFQLQELTTIFGMNIIVSSEVDDFDKIGVYRIERPDKWKSII